jgi:hypothetical protein
MRLQWLPFDLRAQCEYRAIVGFRQPELFSERLQLKKWRDRRPLLTQFADKIGVREYVSERVPTLRVPRLYHVTDSADSLELPAGVEACAIKASHGSGMTAVVRSREELARRRQEIQASAAIWLRTDYSENHGTLEWCYRDVPHRVLFEELLDDGFGSVGEEYRFYMVHGRVGMIQVFRDKLGSNKRSFLRPDWAPFIAEIAPLKNDFAVERPAEADAMLELANELSRGMDFLRVDLYLIRGQIVFGELTNYPSGGKSPWRYTDLDRLLGEQWGRGA